MPTVTATISADIVTEIDYQVRHLVAAGRIPWCDADDMRQDLVVAVLEALAKYDPARASLRTFANGVVRRGIRSLLGRRRAAAGAIVPVDGERCCDLAGRPLRDQAGRDPISPSDATDAVDLRLDLHAAIAGLPAECRETAQALLAGVNPVEMADHVHSHSSTIYRRLPQMQDALGAFGVQPATRAKGRGPRTAGPALTQGDPDMSRESYLCTHTMWQTFKNCRRACEWRYVRHLVPRDAPQALTFGTLIHDCLQRWHRERDLTAVLAHIDAACPDRACHADARATWHLATAMMRGYAARYPTEAFTVEALELPFTMPLRNPTTGRISRMLTLAGKVDGLVREGGQVFLLEHKTTSALDGAYLERLWLDQQITLYSLALQRTLGIPIAGVIYNVLVKARLQQGKGETEAEFALRRADLLAKSKTGKTAAQRREPESDAAFQQRLHARYADPAMFHREVILFTPDQYAEQEAELWLLAQQFIYARRHRHFYRNTAQCFAYGRPCAYLPLCRAGGAPHVIDTLYEVRPPHEELRTADAETPAPVF